MGVFHFDTDLVLSLHGRAPAVATGIKRCAPERFVYSYQGDGDLAAIGLSEIMHAANRGENITSIFVNNSIYGMTGGQMALSLIHIFGKAGILKIMQSQLSYHSRKKASIVETIFSWSGRVSP